MLSDPLGVWGQEGILGLTLKQENRNVRGNEDLAQYGLCATEKIVCVHYNAACID